MSETSKRTGVQKPGAVLLNLVKHIFFHNGWLKLLAVLISVVLWAGLISQDATLTRDKTFTDVNVNVTGMETMKRNGYIVTSDLDQLLDNVSIVAAVPQQQYENAEAATYNVRMDLSRIAGTGQQELKLLSTNSSMYGRVVSTSPSSVLVNVEEYVVRQRIPVSVTVSGDLPEGWYMSTPTVDPPLVTVGGPKSVVETISRARAYLVPDDIEWKEGSILTSLAFELYNRSGEKVESDLLEVTSDSLIMDSVLIEANILPTRVFDVADLVEITGNVAKGYEINDVRISPESVTVAAREEVLAQMDEIPMDRTVSVKNLKETTVFQLKVSKPSEDAIISNDTVTVTVEIGPEE
ncbi:MAG: hypothetical protein IJJ42_09285 [Clostridia bacterium]|nr:hypothetical protein [Clostridia bacterium]